MAQFYEFLPLQIRVQILLVIYNLCLLNDVPILNQALRLLILIKNHIPNITIPCVKVVAFLHQHHIIYLLFVIFISKMTRKEINFQPSSLGEIVFYCFCFHNYFCVVLLIHFLEIVY